MFLFLFLRRRRIVLEKKSHLKSKMRDARLHLSEERIFSDHRGLLNEFYFIMRRIFFEKRIFCSSWRIFWKSPGKRLNIGWKFLITSFFLRRESAYVEVGTLLELNCRWCDAWVKGNNQRMEGWYNVWSLVWRLKINV